MPPPLSRSTSPWAAEGLRERPTETAADVRKGSACCGRKGSAGAPRPWGSWSMHCMALHCWHFLQAKLACSNGNVIPLQPFPWPRMSLPQGDPQTWCQPGSGMPKSARYAATVSSSRPGLARFVDGKAKVLWRELGACKIVCHSVVLRSILIA